MADITELAGPLPCPIRPDLNELKNAYKHVLP